MNYRIPKNLLSTKNAKTIKGEKLGYTTYIMYLSPHKQNSKGKNLCSHASKGCIKACLFKSGAARFNPVQEGKKNKSEYFTHNRLGFMEQLFQEITKIVARHEAVIGDVQMSKNGSKVLRYKKFAIRLNGTADIPFENLKYKDRDNKNIFELFPNVTFYDYTKNHTRFTNKVLPSNYHITFSRSEDNHDESISALKRGYNVAIVFGVKKDSDLPKTYLGYKVINGDESDLRFLDDENVVVGLRYKLLTGKGTKGLNKKILAENPFIVNSEDIIQDQALIGSIAYEKITTN